jgi:hypothetical protein
MVIDRVELQIKILNEEINSIRDDLDNSDSTHFAKFTNLQNKLNQKLAELHKLETFMNNYADKIAITA